jgi:hypothetical protein
MMANCEFNLDGAVHPFGYLTIKFKSNICINKYCFKFVCTFDGTNVSRLVDQN